MQALDPFVDIHCHLLPAIDDGASDWDESLAMARMAVDDGIGTILCTPHQLGSFSHNRGEMIRQRVSELRERLRQAKIPLTVAVGGDVRIEPEMVALLKRGEVVSLADTRKYVLLELPHEIYLPLERLLADLAGAGCRGILSHPERNEGLLRDIEIVPPLVAAGCLMQITAGSLLGEFGPRSKKYSEQLLERGLVHFVSSDAHGTKRRRPLLSAAYQRVVELAGEATAKNLFCRHGAAVAAGAPLAAPRPQTIRKPHASRGLMGWLAGRAY